MKQLSLIILFLFSGSYLVIAQNNQLNMSQQFRLASKIIRVAEPGELADSINVWGDLESTGKYLVPRGSSLTDIISYSGGVRTIRNGQTDLDWSKMRIEVNVHQNSIEKGSELIASYKYRFEENFPIGMWTYNLRNNQTVTVRVKRKPSFRDYLGVIASIVSTTAATIILLDRLNAR